MPILSRQAILQRGHAARLRREDLLARGASWGLFAVLLTVGALVLYASSTAARLSRAAATSVRLADAYAAAAAAVGAAESLERKYRLEPGPAVRQRHDAAADALRQALVGILREGRARDRELVERVRTHHTPYLGGMARLFDAVDQGDLARVRQLDETETEPHFAAIETLVTQAAADNHQEALAALDALERQEDFYARAAPVMLSVSLALATFFALVLRRFRHKLERQRARASHDALHDALTGLPNRTLLLDRFEQALRAAPRHGHRAALMLLDMDRFKAVNDTLGHPVGDQLLTRLAQRLQAALREGDTLARLGGDEFAVLLPQVDGLDAALLAAQRLRKALQQPFDIDGVALDVEVSIGVAVSGLHGDDAATLMQRADAAMYTAKQLGQGVAAYNLQHDQPSPQRLALLGQLRHAMDTGELLLHYQGKYRLSDGALEGAEALLRWRHAERGMVPPGEFIPFAEHTGLIGPLTLHVLNLALGQVRRWLDEGRRMPVAVNISARNLLDGGFAEQVGQALQAHAVPAELLELELTESAVMLEPGRARQLLAALRALGVRLSIDDFGAGYTSLAQLKDLPVNSLKIDRSFIAGLEADPGGCTIVRSIIELGHTLGLSVVAEGIECEDVARLLRELGCDQAQGYHFGRPAPAAELLRPPRQDSRAARLSASPPG